MLLQKLISELEKNKVVLLNKDQLAQILLDSELIIKENTILNNYIRVLKLHDYILIQELTDKDEIAIRRTESIQQAKSFIKSRIDLYDKMWDGCGCKINYYD